MDVPAIVALINDYAARGVMLPKSPDVVALALDDFIVAADQTGRFLGVRRSVSTRRPLRKSARSLSSHAHMGRGLVESWCGAWSGSPRVVACIILVALTMTPRFFETLGYAVVEKSQYPEKIARDCAGCPQRFDCPEICVARWLN